MTEPTIPHRTVERGRRLAEGLAQDIVGYSARGTLPHPDWWARAIRISDSPVLARLLEQAPQVARQAPAEAVRVARTPRGGLVVVRVHGPDWSLVLRPGRPVPWPMFVVLHACTANPWFIDDSDWEPELAAMTAALLAVVDPEPAGPRTRIGEPSTGTTGTGPWPGDPTRPGLPAATTKEPRR